MTKKQTITLPIEIKLEILKILYCFYVARPDEKDFKYIEYQKRVDKGNCILYNELYFDWLYYLIDSHHNVKIDQKTFLDKFIVNLINENLVELCHNPKLIKKFLNEKKSLIGINTPIKISEEGIRYFKKWAKKFKIELPEIIKTVSPKISKNNLYQALYLNNDGDLWREPKSKYCYQMSKSKERYKIVLYFVENKISRYYPTDELAINLGKEKGLLMKEIGKINNIAKNKLKIEDKILDGKRGSGYKINPNYKIVLTDQ